MSRADSVSTSSALVRRLWQYCNVLRDDGLSYPDYVEQLTYLLFLKMSDEQEDGPVRSELGWSTFVNLDAPAMHERYSYILDRLGEGRGTLGLIFRNAKNKIRDPAKLRLLVADLIGAFDWSGISADLKGDAYEGLLEKNARDTKSGAGQYFTPRPLIDAIVECVNPRVGEVVSDPACGTAGFLLAAHDHMTSSKSNLTEFEREHLRAKAIRGVELVEEVARLATMNLLLHGVSADFDDDLPISCADSLANPPTYQVDVVLTNPPFGVKGSVTYSKDGKTRRTVDDLTAHRSDFWVSTANKQLNFVQHVVSLLKPGGRAALVLPDNVLYEAGAGTAIRRRLLEVCNVHTLLRLPTGLFYAAGVKANVVFFDQSSPSEANGKEILVYDLRSDNRFSLKANPLKREDLDDFVDVFRQHAERGADSRRFAEGERWRKFSRTEILASPDCSLDLSWFAAVPKGAPALTRLGAISDQIADQLEMALSHVRAAGGR